MTEILAFSKKFDAAGAQRLAASLEYALASGQDLGPRGVQIRALADLVDQTISELRRAVEALPDASDGHGSPPCVLHDQMMQLRDGLTCFADALAELTASARSFIN